MDARSFDSVKGSHAELRCSRDCRVQCDISLRLKCVLSGACECVCICVCVTWCERVRIVLDSHQLLKKYHTACVECMGMSEGQSRLQ